MNTAKESTLHYIVWIWYDSQQDSNISDNFESVCAQSDNLY